MSMKNPMTLAGIEPPTFRFVAQHLNHCVTAVPLFIMYLSYLINTIKAIVSGLNFYSSLAQLRCTECKSPAVLKDLFDSLSPEDMMTAYPETSVISHKLTLHNIPEEQ